MSFKVIAVFITYRFLNYNLFVTCETFEVNNTVRKPGFNRKHNVNGNMNVNTGR